MTAAMVDLFTKSGTDRAGLCGRITPCTDTHKHTSTHKHNHTHSARQLMCGNASWKITQNTLTVLFKSSTNSEKERYKLRHMSSIFVDFCYKAVRDLVLGAIHSLCYKSSWYNFPFCPEIAFKPSFYYQSVSHVVIVSDCSPWRKTYRIISVL